MYPEKASSYMLLSALVQTVRFLSTRWRPSWIHGSKLCQRESDVKIGILMVDVLEKISSCMLLGALVQMLRFRSTRWRPCWFYGSKRCHSVKLMSESQTFMDDLHENVYSFVKFIALVQTLFFRDGANGHFGFGPLVKIPAFFRGTEEAKSCLNGP